MGSVKGSIRCWLPWERRPRRGWHRSSRGRRSDSGARSHDRGRLGDISIRCRCPRCRRTRRSPCSVQTHGPGAGSEVVLAQLPQAVQMCSQRQVSHVTRPVGRHSGPRQLVPGETSPALHPHLHHPPQPRSSPSGDAASAARTQDITPPRVCAFHTLVVDTLALSTEIP
jgi:hypothetical protein